MSAELKAISEGMAALVNSAEGSVVQVDARRRYPASGIVWSEEGVIVTANHVVRRESVQIGLFNGNRLEAQVIGRDPGIDIAVLRADGVGPSDIGWLPEAEMRVGSLVLALGRPEQTLQASFGILGIIGGAWRVPGGGQASSYVRPDLVMYPGFSGGPILAVDGRIVGMATSAFGREGGIALTKSTVGPVVANLIQHGSIRRAYLGVGAQTVMLPAGTVEETGQESGVLLNSVEAESPAERDGLVVGDTLISLDGEPVRDPGDLALALRGNRADKEVRLQILRGGAPHELLVVLATSEE